MENRSLFKLEEFMPVSPREKELTDLEYKIKEVVQKTDLESQVEFYNLLLLGRENLKGSGEFLKWSQKLGITRETVSLLIKREKLILETALSKEKIITLPVEIVKELTEQEENFSIEEKFMIIESKFPLGVLEQIKSRRKKKITKDIEKEILLEELKKDKKELSELKKRVKKLEGRIQRNNYALENIDNLQFII